ncbi:hypothetical protein LPJ73_003377 [Coemansia sp. RSA 2703]|nr:hypothetical protein LPJ73_003377 [Coemansia sp. RSA 2703]
MGFLISLSAMSVRAFHLMVTYKVHELSSVLSTRNPKGIDSLHSLSPKNGSFEKFGKLVVGSGDSVVTVSKSVSRLKQARQLEKYKRLLPYVRERMLIFYMTVFILIGIILTLVINITDKQFGIRPVKSICIFYWGFLPITAVVVVFFFLVFPVVLWRIWRDNDAYGIRNDLIICDTVGIVCMVITLIWVNLLHETQQKWPGLSFVWVYAIFIHITSVFIPLLRSIQHMRLSEDHDRTFTAENMMDDGPQMSLNISRRAAFNRMFDDPLEYQHFRTFAASCFCSELTGFIEEYQSLKARTLVLLKTTEPSSTVEHLDEALSRTSKEINLNRFRLSQCMVDNALAMYAEVNAAGTSLTGVNVSILQSVQNDKTDDKTIDMQFPALLTGRLHEIYREYVDPNSYASVNASASVVKKISERMHCNDYSLTLLDDLKSDVLFMLYSDVYSRYIRK